MTERLTEKHLQRRAFVYVRQSSYQQVLHNEESRRLQYAMEQRLELLGWRTIEVIDDDLGVSATSTTGREGFQRMVAAVCMGEVGVRLAADCGQVPAEHPLADGPWVFHRAALDEPNVIARFAHLPHARSGAAVPSTEQLSFEIPTKWRGEAS